MPSNAGASNHSTKLYLFEFKAKPEIVWFVKTRKPIIHSYYKSYMTDARDGPFATSNRAIPTKASMRRGEAARPIGFGLSTAGFHTSHLSCLPGCLSQFLCSIPQIWSLVRRLPVWKRAEKLQHQYQGYNTGADATCLIRLRTSIIYPGNQPITRLSTDDATNTTGC